MFTEAYSNWGPGYHYHGRTPLDPAQLCSALLPSTASPAPSVFLTPTNCSEKVRIGGESGRGQCVAWTPESETRIPGLNPGRAVRPLASALPFLSLGFPSHLSSLDQAALGGASFKLGQGLLLCPLGHQPPPPASRASGCAEETANLFTEPADPFREHGPSFPELGY